jgi:hypothetical protein
MNNRNTANPKRNRTKNNPATEMASRIAIGVIAILIYITLCAVTGATVYAIHGWKGPGSGNITIPGNTTTPPVFNPCPAVTELPCPPLPTCQLVNGMECQPKLPTPPCYVPSAPNCQPCPVASTCICPTATTCPPPSPPPEQPKSIELFTKGQRLSKTVSQWLNLYPPYSKNRLIVVTTLLDDMIEPWALVGSIHRCTADSNNGHFNTTCHICQDRYEYINCVMSANLIEEHTLSTMAKGNGWFNEDPEFTPIRGWLPQFVYHLWFDNKIDGIFSRYLQEINAMTVRTTSGSPCRVCKDFNRSVYEKCYSRPPI